MSGASPATPKVEETALAAKRERLHAILRECGSVLVGYSGGVDSAYLAQAALDALGRERVLAVTGLSPSVPQAQRDVARRVARDAGFPHVEIDTEEWTDPRYAANPTNRCYFCKTELYDRLTTLARERGFAAVCDGANADDRSDYRPGARAARERGVRSPLQEAGLTKDEIRALSRAVGLETWDAPASPCLASRIPYGSAVTRERLAEVERAEDALRAIRRWTHLRVRHHGAAARLEVDAADLAALADAGLRARVARAIAAAGFARVWLDLEGYRRGSLNEGVVVPLARSEARDALAAVERGGPQGDVGVWRVGEPVVDDVLRDPGRRAALARAKPAGVRFLAVELVGEEDATWEAGGGGGGEDGADAALRRAQSAGG